MTPRRLFVLGLGLCACTSELIETSNPAVAPAQTEAVFAEAEPAIELATVVLEDTPETEHCKQGRVDAGRDLASGVFAIETFGYPASCYGNYEQELWSSYQVELRRIAGCMVDEQILQHSACYNEVMEAEIEAKHGPDIWEKASKAAGC